MFEYEYDDERDVWVIHTMNKLKQAMQDNPADHLHEWLQKAHPKVFKQWEAIWNIQRSVDE